jgi:Fe-S cluster assembly protein SufD
MSANAQATTPLARLATAQAALPGGRSWAAWRGAALERLVAVGLPTPRDDAWKYTNLRLLGRRDLEPAPPRPLATSALADLPAIAGPRLVFVDGRFHAALSATRLPDGCAFTPFAARFAAESPDALGAALAGDAALADERVRTLNASLAADGPSLVLAPGARPAEPIHLVHVATGGGAYPRTRVELGAGAALELLEYHLTAGGADAFVAAAGDFRLAAEASLVHSSLQVAGERTILLDDASVTVAAGARYAHRLVALGGQLTRLDLRVALDGPGARAELAGVFLADGAREQHLRTLVAHRAPQTASDQLYRGVAAGRGRGSYDGKVVVHPGAFKTESRQSSRNLLIGREAAIESRPQLEINADDVKCSHGATTGTLDEQMMFYLLARGLDRDTARALLTYAFVGDVLRRLAPAALRRAAEARVLGRLPAAELLREFVA